MTVGHLMTMIRQQIGQPADDAADATDEESLILVEYPGSPPNLVEIDRVERGMSGAVRILVRSKPEHDNPFAVTQDDDDDQ